MATNRLKSLRLQQQNGNYSSEIVISPDAKNVYLENNQDLQKAVGNYNPQSDGGTIKANLDQIKQDIQNLNTNKAGKNEVGKPPKIAKTAGEMSDTNSVYVYTGETTSTLTKGNWYSYSNGEWVSGGSYIGNPVTVDSTLLESGSAADAKVTGDRLKDLQDLINTKDFDLSNILIRQQDDGYSFYLVDRNDPTKKTENSLGLKLPIDKTLKIEDYIADAKATGDAITNLDNYTKQQIRLLNEIYDALQIATLGNEATSLKSLITDLSSKTLGANYDSENGDLQTQITDLITLTISTNTPGNLQAQINDINSNSFGTEEGGNSLQQQINSLHNEVFGEEGQSSGTSLKDELAQLQRQTLGAAAADNSLKQQIDALNAATLGEEEGDNSLKQQLEQVQTDLEESIENAIKPNDLGLTQDAQKRVFPTFRGTASNSGIIISPETDTTLSTSGKAADAGTVGTRLTAIQQSILDATVTPNRLGLEQDPDTKMVYPTFDNERSENGIVLAGGGGGGTDTNNAVLTATNITGWLSKAVPVGNDCIVRIRWSSIEDDAPTGSGSARITVNNTIRGVVQIDQGDISINLKPYLSTGQNTVKIRISDVYDNGRTLNFNINYINFRIESTFIFDAPFTQSFLYTFTPYGTGVKTIHFKVDGIELPTMETSASGAQLNYLIPAQTHGGHSLEVYFTATLDGEEIESNKLYNEFMFIQTDNTTPIVTSPFNETDFDQYSSIVIPYRVYDPLSEITEVSIYVNGILNSTYDHIDRTQQNFIYKADKPGATTISFEVRQQSGKIISLNIKAVNIDVQTVTDDLALYLSSKGRSNNDKTDIRSSWIYSPDPQDSTKDISAEFRNFNWILDGWQVDNQNIPVLRVMGDGRVYIPYNVFGTDCKTTGKTIEIEFSTSYVVDYSSPVIECINHSTEGTTDPVGFSITSQQVTMSGAQTRRETLYKDNEHITVSIVIEKQTKNRLMYIYVNGVMSRAVQYAAGERFAQLQPTGILIGSNDCAVDIYSIRIYDNDLSRRQVLNNWIAETQDGGDLVDRYDRNNVYEDDNITVNSLPGNLPYMIIEAEQLSQYKGDKKTVSGSYIDPTDPSKSFTFAGCQNNVQGTSSQGYYRKNYDMQFKEGFELTAGHSDDYGLRQDSIPFNRFVLKADVASSESANNTRLTMFYNDTCPYKIPEMEEDSHVRWGIEGVPIVVFWYQPSANTTTFLGKYNFNLPKRAPAPYGYADEDNDESWEFQWNNTANVKFQDKDFTSTKWDETEQTNKPAWYDDWQARFPSDTYRDINQLQELVAWVNSTWMAAATNETLASPVVYRVPSSAIFDREECQGDDSYTITEVKNSQQATIGYDIRCTKDTAARRLAKFRAQFSDYFEVRSATFYYIFTEFFLMIDSWAKNMFIGFHGSPVSGPGRKMRRKAVIEPYDMDTAIGINNSGELMFDYHYETIDTVSSLISGGEGAAEGKQTPVMNAQDSVLWSNFRDTFRAEIVAMYSTLRSTTWNYNTVANMFTEHQSKWPEAIFNEDAYMKYLYPVDHAVVRNPNQPDETKPDAYMTTTEYLKMLQGSKQQQRRWWLFNRFRYIDSKYNTGDAQNTRITLRIFDNDPINGITLSSAIDMYEGVMFGAGSTPILIRTDANTAQHFIYAGTSSIQQFETHILSGDMIVDVGDLSKFSPNEIRFSNASRLRRLKVGDASRNNANLTELDVTNSSLLEYINCMNCTNLATPVDLSNSPRLKEAYFNGTKLTGVEFADGGLLETLYLPQTITSLSLLNLSKLNDVNIPSYSHITSLYLSNINTDIINPVTVLSAMANNSNVHIDGFNLTVSSEQQIEDIYNSLERMKGQSRERVWNETTQRYAWNYTYYDHPIVAGTITLLPAAGQDKSSISGTLKAKINAHYPNLEIKADETVSTVYYYDWEGNLITTRQVTANKNNPNPNAPDIQHPVRPNTAQYTYTWAGWALELGGRYTNRALQDIQSDRNVYAAYSFEGKTYTVRFLNRTNSSGGYTVLQTKTEVMYGANVSYTGATPVSYQGPADEYEWGTRGVDPNDPEGNGVYPWSPMPTNIQGNLDCYAQFKDIRSIVSQYFAGTLTNIKLDNLNGVGNYAFYQYPNFTLKTGEIIVQNNIGYAAFQGDSYIYGQNNKPILIKANVIGGRSFAYKRFSSNTRTLKIQAQRLDANSFQYALRDSLSSNRITTVELIQPEDSTTPIQIRDAAFQQETTQPFTKLIINSPYKATLVNQTSLPGVFKYCLGGIYVSSDLLNEYKTDSNWGRYKYHIFPMEDKNIPIENTDFSTISKTWAEIAADCNSDQPLDTSIYHTGDIKKFTVNGVSHYAILIGINKDKLASDNTKTAKTTWISWSPIGSRRIHNNSNTTINWEDCQLRTYLKNTIKPQLEEDIRNNLKTVTKTFYDATQALTLVTQDDITIPSYYEINGSNFESSSSLSVNYGNLSNQSILKNNNYKQIFLKNLSTESSSSGDNYYKCQWTRTSSSLGYFYLTKSDYYYNPYYRFPGMDTRDTCDYISYDTRLNTSSCYYRIMFCL